MDLQLKWRFLNAITLTETDLSQDDCQWGLDDTDNIITPSEHHTPIDSNISEETMIQRLDQSNLTTFKRAGQASHGQILSNLQP